MTSKYIVVHRADGNNVGDMASNPLQYFLPKEDYEFIDIVDVRRNAYNSNKPMIVGGGGLINNELFGDSLRNVLSSADYVQLLRLWDQRWDLCDSENAQPHQQFLIEYQALIKSYLTELKSNSAPRFLWGAGHNSDLQRKAGPKLEYPSWIAEFDLVGIRDWNQNQPWVPCASCMHPAFDKEYPVKNEVIWFEHKKQLIKDFGNDPIPRFVNSGNNIDHTIELLGSANTILTNSYHGAYWGTLLGKRVIVTGVWSSKFMNFRHQPIILEKDRNWKEVVDQAPVFDNALEQCRESTEAFWQQIQAQS